MKHHKQTQFVADRKVAPGFFGTVPTANRSALSSHKPGIHLRFDAVLALPAPLGQAPGGSNGFCPGRACTFDVKPGGMIG